MEDVIGGMILVFRVLVLLAGIGCLVAFWLVDGVFQEIAWGVYATALFALAIALKRDERGVL